MTDDDTTGLDLPRRKLLGALGAVGASSAGAGLGTSAYLNDTESFTGNSLTAGTLNLQIGGSVPATNSDAINVELGSQPTQDRSTSVAFFTLNDIKPGDLAILCLEIVIIGNPAYLKINGSVVSDDNTVNEPEAASSQEDDTLGTTGNAETGELAVKTDIQAFGPNQNVDESSLSSIQKSLNDGSFSSTTNGGSSTFATGQEAIMSSVFSKSGTDYVLTDTDGPRCFEAGTYRFYFILSVDKTVGNVIQSDSLELDLTVDAVQCRHNDDTPFTDDG